DTVSGYDSARHREGGSDNSKLETMRGDFLHCSSFVTRMNLVTALCVGARYVPVSATQAYLPDGFQKAPRQSRQGAPSVCSSTDRTRATSASYASWSSSPRIKRKRQ